MTNTIVSAPSVNDAPTRTKTPTKTAALWEPSSAIIEQANMTAFMQHINKQYSLNLSNYQDLHHWSVASSDLFWRELWLFCDVIGDAGVTTVNDQHLLEKACWFPDAVLNYAENLLRSRSDDLAIIAATGTLPQQRVTRAQLHDQVSQCAQYLRHNGIVKGDRVAAIMPNGVETIVAMLATASIGAIWTSVSPDFGQASIVERFGQTQPKILVTVDAYTYNGKQHNVLEKAAAVAAAVNSIECALVVADYSNTPSALLQDYFQTDSKKQINVSDWAFVQTQYQPQPIDFEPMGFNDPLFILYSSGTTGKPKCIVHRTGGVLLQHLKEHQLHCDIHAGDKVFYYTTCGWMMWNWLASVLASNATLVLYDESPFYPNENSLFQYVEQEGINVFGTSASYLNHVKKQQLRPIDQFALPDLRLICSTGSVLPAETFDYVYQAIKTDVCLASISGGTDIISCFVLGNPTLPVYRGESQCLGLGLDMQVWDEQGQPLQKQKGELVCCNSFPCQPLGFWGDETGERYHDAYFSRFDNTWCHGDYVEITEHNGVIIYGRSDATLNPGGVRIGTAEIYRYAESLDEVLESVVIGQQWGDDVRVVLFVKLKPQLTINDDLITRIKKTIKANCTPRHVPAVILQVDDIPKTKTGKIVELAVREVVHGRPVKNKSVLVNPEALDCFCNHSCLIPADTKSESGEHVKIG